MRTLESGSTTLITGASSGIGRAFAQRIAAAGGDLVLVARREGVLMELAGDLERRHSVRVSVIAHDLDEPDAGRALAEKVGERGIAVDALINNAGVMYPPKQTTADGFELQFGTNHLGHFALTGLLLDHLLQVEGSRVVTVASIAHNIQAGIHFDDLQWERSYNRVAAYGQSKLANLMFTYELQRRLAATQTPTVAVAAHPGISNTELMRHIPGSGLPGFSALAGLVTNSPAVGALATLRAATDPAVRGGQYYGPSGFRELVGHPVLVQSNRQSHDTDVQQRLWSVSEELTGVKFPV